MGYATTMWASAIISPEIPVDIVADLFKHKGSDSKLLKFVFGDDFVSPLYQDNFYETHLRPKASFWPDNDMYGSYIMSASVNVNSVYTDSIIAFLDWIKPYVTSGVNMGGLFAVVAHDRPDIPNPLIYFTD
jgi:hypothetical protein